MSESRFALLLSCLLIAACSSSIKEEEEEETASQQEELSLAGAAAKELSAAITAQGKQGKQDQSAASDIETRGTLLHKCVSKGTRSRIRLEVYVFERSTEDLSPGAVVACTGARRVIVPAQIGLASGSGYYWNDDTSFTLGGTTFGLSVNDPEDYGYSESMTPARKQLQFDCTHAPDGWGPFDF